MHLNRLLPDEINARRLLLRRHAASDADDVLAYATDEEWQRFLPAVPSPYTKTSAIEFLIKVEQREWSVHPTWAVCVASKVVGSVSMQFFAGHRVAETSYGIARKHWGKGLATEAVRALVDTAFNECPDLVRVRARADAENIGSRRVMEKLGMTFEGVMRCNRLVRDELRDEAIYGILRSEWVKDK